MEDDKLIRAMQEITMRRRTLETKLSSAISTLIQEFEESTGILVQSVDVQTTVLETYGGKTTSTFEGVRVVLAR